MAASMALRGQRLFCESCEAMWNEASMPKRRTVLAIVQARMGSSRLPGKVMLPLCGRPMIAHILDRLHAADTVDAVWVATSTSSADDPLVEFLQMQGEKVYRGSEEDVLDRFAMTARAAGVAGSDVVLRHTADCPLLDPVLIDRVVQAFLDAEKWDYAQPMPEEGLIRGLDTEVFTAEALFRVEREAKTAREREHVTPYFYEHPELFCLGDLLPEAPWKDPTLRLCVDEKDDYMLVSRIYNELYRAGEVFSFSEVLDYLRNNPELACLNSHVHQKRA